MLSKKCTFFLCSLLLRNCHYVCRLSSVHFCIDELFMLTICMLLLKEEDCSTTPCPGEGPRRGTARAAPHTDKFCLTKNQTHLGLSCVVKKLSLCVDNILLYEP